MAQIKTVYPSGNTLYFLLTRETSNHYWNDNISGWEGYDAANISGYATSMAEDGNVGVYRGTFPSHTNVVSGEYTVVLKRQVGANIIEGDTPIGLENYYWDETDIYGSAIQDVDAIKAVIDKLDTMIEIVV